MFYALEQSEINDISPSRDNYQVAEELKLTPAKVSRLRREAYARWAEREQTTAILRNELKKYFEEKRLTRMLEQHGKKFLDEKLVPIALDNPAARDELERRIRSMGAIPDYVLNRDVIYVNFNTLCDIALSFSDEKVTAAKARAQQELDRNTTLRELLKTDLSKLSWRKARSALSDAAISAIEDGLKSGVLDTAATVVSAVFTSLSALQKK